VSFSEDILMSLKYWGVVKHFNQECHLLSKRSQSITLPGTKVGRVFLLVVAIS
jgi:hypothetical protein